ncbi:uncharacterized protein FYW61_019327 [Anableps anableps]
MGKLQVSVAYAMLMVFDTNLVQAVGLPCLMCPTGRYITRNCSRHDDISLGTKCAPCTDCSAIFLDTLAPCSAYKDAVCGNKIMPTPTAAALTQTAAEPTQTAAAPTGVPPLVWILIGVFASLFLLVLLALFFRRMFLKVMTNFSKLPPAETTISETTDTNYRQTRLQACAA